MAPSVSVIINFLDAAAFLEEAVKSVFAQTYHDWELLLVDDGSTDASTAIAESYAKRHPDKVRYLEHEGHANRGTSASRNLGMRAAHGALVAFLDADDVWLPERLARHVPMLADSERVAAVVGPATYWYEDGSCRPQAMSVRTGLIEARGWIGHILAGEDNAACPSAALVRRDAAMQVGGFHEAFRGLYDDQVFWCRLNLDHAIYHDPTPLVLYRIHAASCCSSATACERAAARTRYLRWLAEALAARPRCKWLALMARSRLLLSRAIRPES